MGRFLSGRRVVVQPRVSAGRKPELSWNAKVLAQRAKDLEEEKLNHVKRRTTRIKSRRKAKVEALRRDFHHERQFGFRKYNTVALSLMVSLWELKE